MPWIEQKLTFRGLVAPLPWSLRLLPKRPFSRTSADCSSELPVASFFSPCLEIDPNCVQARKPDPKIESIVTALAIAAFHGVFKSTSSLWTTVLNNVAAILDVKGRLAAVLHFRVQDCTDAVFIPQISSEKRARTRQQNIACRYSTPVPTRNDGGFHWETTHAVAPAGRRELEVVSPFTRFARA